jgi:hypothetical protein
MRILSIHGHVTRSGTKPARMDNEQLLLRSKSKLEPTPKLPNNGISMWLFDEAKHIRNAWFDVFEARNSNSTRDVHRIIRAISGSRSAEPGPGVDD